MNPATALLPGSSNSIYNQNILNPGAPTQNQPSLGLINSIQPAPATSSNLSSPTGNQSTTNNTGGTNTNGTGTGYAPNVLSGLYDQQIGQLQNYANNAIPQYQTLDQNIINQGYDTQKTNLDAQHQLGQANFQHAQDQLDTQRANSLRDLGNQLRGMYNSYSNQIGTMGAGNSSAVPLISYALQQQGNTSTNDLNTQFNQQQTGLNLQDQGLETNYQGQLKSLDNWKNTNLQQIAENYAKQLDQLHQQIMQAQGDKARFLSLYGTQALADQALAQMQALNKQYTDQVDSIHGQFQGLQAPNADISQYTSGFNVSPFSPQQLQGLSLPANQVETTNSNIPVNLARRPDENQTVPAV